MPNQKLSHEILSAALAGLEAQRDQVDLQIAEVRRMLRARPEATSADGTPDTAAVRSTGRRRGMSAAARRRIGEAQRKRWEAYHMAQEAPSRTKKAAGKRAGGKRRISAAGRKAIAEAARKRWAEFRKSASKAPAKAAKRAGKAAASAPVTE
jgi:hypothetical protein